MKKFFICTCHNLYRILAVIAVVAVANPFAIADSKESQLQKRKTYLEQKYAEKTSVVEKMIAGKHNYFPPSTYREAEKATTAMPQSTESGDLLYGFLMDDAHNSATGIYSITVDENATTQLVHESSLHIAGGTYVPNELILQTYSATDFIPTGLYAKDIDSGKERQITSYGNADPFFFDMTYDQSQDVVYAVGGGLSDPTMSIYSIDINDGSYEKLFELDCMFYTLAATDDGGILYGIDEIGQLYRISVADASSQLVEWTGYIPTYMQSMTYNTQDGLLYWALYTDMYTSSLVTIDPATATPNVIAERLGNNAEVGALYFSNDPTSSLVPSAPTDFDVMTGSQGALQATLMWVNPTTSLNGDQLTSLQRIDIYRNGEIVHSIEKPQTGKAQTWVDTNVPQGLTTYRIIAVNEYGNGRAAQSQPIFIGRDAPGTVRNLNATKQADSYVVNITWDAPIVGKNNGYFDASSLSYKVIRYPDGKVIADNTQQTEAKDETITETQGYSYGVVATNNDGESDTIRSNTIVVGPALDIPYSCSFATEEERNMWVVEDSNGDNCTWYYDSNFGGDASWFMHYYYNEDGVTAANDWFFSAPLHFEQGKQYILSYDVRLGGNLSQEKFRVALCNGMSSESVAQEIDNCTDFESNFTFVNRSVSFIPETSGDFSLGFHVYSDANQYLVHITNIKVTEAVSTDMLIESFKGMEVAVRGEETTYEVTVRNNGAEAMTNFIVNVADANDGTIYGTQDVNYNLGINKTLIVPVKCKITASADTQLTAEVIADDDAESSNNKSRTIEVEVLQDAEKYDMVKIGDNERKVSAYVPFDLHNTYSVTQMLFNPTLLRFSAATIERIGYNYYVQEGEYAKNIKLKIYMRNAENEGSIYQWIDPESFTLVYDGEISLDEDNNASMLKLDVPFQYDGKELVIMTKTEGGCEDYSYNYFFATTQDVSDQNFYSMSWNGNEDTFDPNVAGMEARVYPQFTFVLADAVQVGGVTDVKDAGYRITVLAGRQVVITGEYDKAYLYSTDGVLLQTDNGDGIIETHNQGIYLLRVLANGSAKTHKIIIK